MDANKLFEVDLVLLESEAHPRTFDCALDGGSGFDVVHDVHEVVEVVDGKEACLVLVEAEEADCRRGREGKEGRKDEAVGVQAREGKRGKQDALHLRISDGSKKQYVTTISRKSEKLISPSRYGETRRSGRVRKCGDTQRVASRNGGGEGKKRRNERGRHCTYHAQYLAAPASNL